MRSTGESMAETYRKFHAFAYPCEFCDGDGFVELDGLGEIIWEDDFASFIEVIGDLDSPSWITSPLTESVHIKYSMLCPECDGYGVSEVSE